MSENNTAEMNKQVEKPHRFPIRKHRKSGNSQAIPNLYNYKLKRIFDYEPLEEEKAYRGTIGIPRVLGMYETYPFWHIFFSCLGYRVVLSPLSTREIYELGAESVSDESECYPAKLTHGHIMWLLNQGVKNIFCPCIAYERKEVRNAANNLNCPMVGACGNALKNSIPGLSDVEITYLYPFISFETESILTERLCDVFTRFDIPEYEIRMASLAGWKELCKSLEDIRKKGDEVLRFLKKTRRRGIVLAGYPYHIDPEINHGIPEVINSLGLAVLTPDSISHLAKFERFTTTTDHFTYASRLVSAASFVAKQRNLEYVRFTSVGCGIDCITTPLIRENLAAAGKLFTELDISETEDSEATLKRIKAMLLAFNEVDFSGETREIVHHKRDIFTGDMRREYTLLLPTVLPYHSALFEAAMKRSGLNLEMLSCEDPALIGIGYEYIPKTVCAPSAIIVGAILSALASGHYDVRKTAVLVPQTADGCAAACNTDFVRRALAKAGFTGIPVIPLSVKKVENHPGFKLNAHTVRRIIEALIYSDLLMQLRNRTYPYETSEGSVDALFDSWIQKCGKALRFGRRLRFRRNIKKMVADFDVLPLDESSEKQRVGIVSDIFSLYLPTLNGNLVKNLTDEGCEVVMPALLDYFTYNFLNEEINASKFGKKQKAAKFGRFAVDILNHFRKPAAKALKKSKRFTPAPSIDVILQNASSIISAGNQYGEGWLLSGEAVSFINLGISRLEFIAPVSCTPAHIVIKSAAREISRRYPEVEIKING